MLPRIPKFKTIQEEAEYWDKTDLSGWMEGGEWVPAGSGGLTEERCPKCYSRRKVRRFNLHIADDRVILRRVKGYYCPKCKITSPARDVEKRIPRIEKAVEKVLT